jgi:predicted RNA-binding Zn ribbon-like protein
VDFDSYSNHGVDGAVAVVNSGEQLDDVGGLAALLADLRLSSIGDVDDKDLEAVRRLRRRLRAIFDAEDAGTAAALINALLMDAKALPLLTNHDGEGWHLHYAPPDRPVWARLAAEAAIGLAGVIRADGFDRMRTCAADDCNDVFVDGSKNHSRRFCHPETCGNRATTAAYRARRREARPVLEPG